MEAITKDGEQQGIRQELEVKREKARWSKERWRLEMEMEIATRGVERRLGEAVDWSKERTRELSRELEEERQMRTLQEEEHEFQLTSLRDELKGESKRQDKTK